MPVTKDQFQAAYGAVYAAGQKIGAIAKAGQAAIKTATDQMQTLKNASVDADNAKAAADQALANGQAALDEANSDQAAAVAQAMADAEAAKNAFDVLAEQLFADPPTDDQAPDAPPVDPAQ